MKICMNPALMLAKLGELRINCKVNCQISGVELATKKKFLNAILGDIKEYREEILSQQEIFYL